jgi:hypothetical protein
MQCSSSLNEEHETEKKKKKREEEIWYLLTLGNKTDIKTPHS